MTLGEQVPHFRVFIDVSLYERAARHDFQAPGAGHLQRAGDKLRGDAAVPGLRRHFRMGDGHHPAFELIIRHGRDAIDVKLEAGESGVVANLGSHCGNMGRCRRSAYPEC